MEKHNILIFKDSGLYYGSLEKLLQLFAKYLSEDFNIFFAYAPQASEQLLSNIENRGITLVPFSYRRRQPHEPFGFKHMHPSLMDIIQDHSIHCIFTDVFANFQFPMNAVPAGIPFVLISPFGHYATNGNVVKTYVSGQSNFNRLKKRGIKNIEILYNPLEDFPAEVFEKPPIGNRIIFGRVGRGDDSTFDPISVEAFKKLETEFGDKVRYIVVNPAPAWRKHAAILGIRNMEYREKLSQKELQQFFREIDVFAHARKDGETVGMAIGEAMLAGNPILTHRSRFHNDQFNILDAGYALWAEVGDTEQYYQNMKWMVEHPGEIRVMGQRARKQAQGIFGIESQLPGIVETFTNAAKQCTHYSLRGRIIGFIKLYWENTMSVPFWFAKKFIYVFPSLGKLVRRV